MFLTFIRSLASKSHSAYTPSFNSIKSTQSNFKTSFGRALSCEPTKQIFKFFSSFFNVLPSLSPPIIEVVPAFGFCPYKVKHANLGFNFLSLIKASSSVKPSASQSNICGLNPFALTALARRRAQVGGSIAA